ncbi:MAG: hypothetical protein JNL83_22020 [Myxococcales bacterium]|nr:hypothetical protein [Myxococcales bacterium]
MLAVFVVIAYLFAATRGHTALAVSAIVLAVLVVVNRRSSSRARAFHAANKDAYAALGRGDFDAARQTWATWADSVMPRIAALARHNLAWTQIRTGKLDEAIATLESNEATRLGALEAIGLAATSAADRALAHALLDHAKDAEVWLDRAEARLLAATMPTSGAIALARSVWHCRAGRVDVAAKLLADGWREIESTTTGDVLRPLRVVRAFAAAAAGPREPALETPRPAYPGEYTFLGTTWPEMAAFLATHELS